MTEIQERFSETVEGQNQYLTFALGGEMYAIGILYIKEIIEYGGVTPVPMTPELIHGVLNLRGNVLPVIDLSVRLDGTPQPIGERTCIVIVEVSAGNETVNMGIVVDAVKDVVTLPSQDLEPAPSFGSRIRVDFIRNIGKFKERFITLLDIERVLSIKELSALYT
ncbi:MAG: purine-binding chemotaxis protein CheW [Gammaproteobacteria bacterium]|nr:purine-binding chemotaxis protein CheW [Gammaproteobacteria bacterium]